MILKVRRFLCTHDPLRHGLMYNIGFWVFPALDCPPWMLDPEKDTEKRTAYISSRPGYVPNVVLTYFDVGEAGLASYPGAGMVRSEAHRS